MRVVISGSRTWTNYTLIWERLARLPRGTTIVHGAAPRGADELADQAARALRLPIEHWPAQWNRYGRGAGILRNLDMLETKPDLVICFWDGKSRGTRHMIDSAERRNLPIEVVIQNQENQVSDPCDPGAAGGEVEQPQRLVEVDALDDHV